MARNFFITTKVEILGEKVVKKNCPNVPEATQIEGWPHSGKWRQPGHTDAR